MKEGPRVRAWLLVLALMMAISTQEAIEDSPAGEPATTQAAILALPNPGSGDGGMFSGVLGIAALMPVTGAFVRIHEGRSWSSARIFRSLDG